MHSMQTFQIDTYPIIIIEVIIEFRAVFGYAGCGPSGTRSLGTVFRSKKKSRM